MSEPAFVRFWGTRGSIPTPGHKTRRFGGNTSCVEIRVGDLELVCDGGTGLRELGLDLLQRGRQKIEAHFFFSHMHWDHIQGFPFFVPAYGPDSELFVYETSAGDDRVQKLLHGQMRSEYFPVEFGDLGARITARHFEQDVGALAPALGTDRRLDAFDRDQACFQRCGPDSARMFFEETTALRRLRQRGIDPVIIRVRQGGWRLTFVGQGFF